MKLYKICVNGSREFNDYRYLKIRIEKHVLNAYNKHGYDNIDKIAILSGGARGADRLGEIKGYGDGFKVIRYPANWDKHGKKAGMLRNIEMIDACDELISFWDGESKGTKHAIEYAQSIGKKVTVYLYKQDKDYEPEQSQLPKKGL